MAREKPTDDIEKFLAEQKSMDDRKQAMIDDLLRQREDAMKAFDGKLGKLGYKPGTKPKKSHHKQQLPADSAKPMPKA